MEAYTSFAQVYDLFMDNVPYEEWCAYIAGILRDYGIEDGLVLELGCGTGSLTRALSGAGYDMIGVDNSEDMLEIAMDKQQEGEDILYLLQDMREFELYGTGGILIFDMNTLYKYEEILGENTFAENRPVGSFIWENYFDEETGINEYDLTLFIRDQEEGDLYRKFEETHYQRAYRLSEVRRAVEEAGMEFLTSYDAGTREPVREDSQRIYIIAREKGKMRRE